MNDEQLFRLLEEVTGCGRIRCFRGRVYRMLPGPEFYHGWHDDVAGSRLAAMSINLSGEAYRGGVLQIREAGSKRILQEVANPGAGDAVVFRVSRQLEHRINEVEGCVPRTALAGFFESEPDYRTVFRGVMSDLGGLQGSRPGSSDRGEVCEVQRGTVRSRRTLDRAGLT
jgi:hypothetical protein